MDTRSDLLQEAHSIGDHLFHYTIKPYGDYELARIEFIDRINELYIRIEELSRHNNGKRSGRTRR